MIDGQVSVVIEAVLELAVRLRDEVGPGVEEAARQVLAAAGGDPLAAVCVAAALVDVDRPVDRWWAGLEPVPDAADSAVQDHGSRRPHPWTGVRPESVGLAPCGTRAAAVRHKRRGEQVDPACAAAAHAYRAAAYRRLQATG